MSFIVRTTIMIFVLSSQFSFGKSTKVENSLYDLKNLLKLYGAPSLSGIEQFDPKTGEPILYFGKKKINKSYFLVDFIKKKRGGTATVFVKQGSEYVRISTNVLKPDGNRAVGTKLAKNKAYEEISKGNKFCGKIEIISKMYDTCYEPIKDSNDEIIGIYYVGYIL